MIYMRKSHLGEHIKRLSWNACVWVYMRQQVQWLSGELYSMLPEELISGQ